jgi:hypothetical protein
MTGAESSQAVSLSNHGLEVAGLVWVVAQGLPNLPDGGIDSLLSINENILPHRC